MEEQVEVIREEPESVESPVTELPRDDLPLGSSSDADLDQLLREYDEKVGRTEPAPVSDETPVQDESSDLDYLLSQLDGPSPDQQRIEQLTGEIGSLRQAELERQARADFEGWSTKLQDTLGPNVDQSFARTALLALSVENPALEAAWRFRHLTDTDRRAADLEFQQLEVLYNQAQRAPADPRKAEAMAQMERRGQELALMMNSHKILTNAWRDVQRRASKAPPPIDELATADHDAVAQAVRDANHGDIPEPPVRWGSLSARDGRERVIKQFGFDPGWGW